MTPDDLRDCYPIDVFYSDTDEGYVADVPDLDVCSAFGRTPQEAVDEVAVARDSWLAVARELGRAIPTPRVD